MKSPASSMKVSVKLSIVELLLVVCACVLMMSTVSAQVSGPKRLVVLYWDNKEFPGNVRFEESFKNRLRLAGREDLEYYPEYYEVSRFPEESYAVSFRNYLQAKYANRSVDLVVASADAPLKFLLTNRPNLFPNIPIVFVANDPPAPDVLATGAGATGLHYKNSYRETLDLALRLHPGTKRVFVVSTSLKSDYRFDNAAQLELSGFGKLDITYLTDLPLNELIAKTESLPADSLILFVRQQSLNGHGKLLESYEVLSRIAPGSPAPIYGFSTVVLGSGIVGGYLQGPEINGANVAEIAERILNGTPAREIPVQEAQKVPMFDWRELRRWQIPESSLPPDSVVRFKQFTFWELYKWRVVGVISLVLLQTVFIGVLLVERGRRRRARQALDRLNTELEERIAARTAALNAKSRELESFAYSVAHDLKAPLRGIDGYSRLLLEDHGADLDEEGRSFLQTIQGSTEEMNQLIDDLLEYSRLERREFRSDQVELAPLIATVVQQKRREAADTPIEFIVNVADGSVVADPNGLIQSLRNYLDNAVKFTREVSNPRIEVGSKETPYNFVVWVRDNGVGFDMKYHDRIFDIFQRLNPGEQYPGTGVGLAIVRKAMERMGGRAWGEGEPGHGATFYLTIPKQTNKAILSNGRRSQPNISS